MSPVLRQSKHGSEKNFQTQSISERRKFSRTKNRDNVSCVRAVGQPDIPGKTTTFGGGNSHNSLKTKKIPGGRLVLGDGRGDIWYLLE